MTERDTMNVKVKVPSHDYVKHNKKSRVNYTSNSFIVHLGDGTIVEVFGRRLASEDD